MVVDTKNPNDGVENASQPLNSSSNGLVKWFGPGLRVACALLLIPVLLSLMARHWWLADICANLRVQCAIAIAVIAFAAMLFRERKTAVISVLVLISQAWWFRGTPTDVVLMSTSPEIVITTANVYTANRRYADIQTQFFAADADVIVVVELSSHLAKFLSEAFTDRYPYSLTEPQDAGNFGIGVYSKHPFVKAEVISFVPPNVPSIFLSTVINGEPLRILATHTLPPVGPGAFQRRNDHLTTAASLVSRMRMEEPGVPIVVAGDLNLTPWSPVFYDFCNAGGLEPFVGDAFQPTWYRYPIFPCGLVLDHVLFTPDLACLKRAVGPDVGSDHRFVTATLGLRSDE